MRLIRLGATRAPVKPKSKIINIYILLIFQIVTILHLAAAEANSSLYREKSIKQKNTIYCGTDIRQAVAE
jgi:hypothetical protein